MVDLIGRTPINPFLFYTGKLAGYITWVVLLLLIFDIEAIDRMPQAVKDGVSLVVLSAGMLLSIISLFNLGKSTRLGLPTEDTSLQTSGLYKFSRNPMYVGFNLMTLASMVYTFNLWIILLGLYSLLVYHFIILGEEKFLEKRFGQAFDDYKKVTGRYL